MSFIAGPYSWTFGSVAPGVVGAVYAIGTIEDAPTLEINNEVDPIKGDNTGATLQDGVYRGGSCYLDMVLMEFNSAAAKYIYNPFTTTLGEIGCIGSLLSTYADALIGTPISPSCTLGPTTPLGSNPEYLKIFTAKKAVLAPGFPIRLLFGSRLRNVPIRFQLLPYTDDVSPYPQRFFKLSAP